MQNLNNALEQIKKVCDEWIKLKEERKSHDSWLFNYKLYDLAYKCPDAEEFSLIAEQIFNDWSESARIIAGYSPERWNYYKYFKHDNHNGSYFTFCEDIDSNNALDFWAENVGLEWDWHSSPEEWSFTLFEKAIWEVYGETRFSTDRLKPEDYNPKELEIITNTLLEETLPVIKETLEERKAIISMYNKIKASQCDYIPEKEEEE